MLMAEPPTADVTSAAVAHARALFLDDDHSHGCAETTLVALATAYGLPEPHLADAAMALNGGVAYRGGVCGAITGSAIAVGRLAATLTPVHADAKRVARETIAELSDAFAAEFGALDCRALIGRDIRSAADHAAFLRSDVWRTTCLLQIEFAVGRLASLAARLRAEQGGARSAELAGEEGSEPLIP